jgi:hypothetical protein
MAATAEGKGGMGVWNSAPGRKVRGAFYTKLGVRTRQIKGAFKGVGKYRTSQPTSGVGCTHPAVLHQFSPSPAQRNCQPGSPMSALSQCASSAPFVIMRMLWGGRREIEGQR